MVFLTPETANLILVVHPDRDRAAHLGRDERRRHWQSWRHYQYIMRLLDSSDEYHVVVIPQLNAHVSGDSPQPLRLIAPASPGILLRQDEFLLPGHLQLLPE